MSETTLPPGPARQMTPRERSTYNALIVDFRHQFPLAPLVISNQAAFIMASDVACSDARLLTADSMRLFANQIRVLIPMADDIRGVAGVLEAAAPRRARACA